MADTQRDTVQDSSVESESQGPRPKAEPIESRFLFVDVAAMRAKQLRRGALVRLSDDNNPSEEHFVLPFKAERVAMEEVKRGLVLYEGPNGEKKP